MTEIDAFKSRIKKIDSKTFKGLTKLQRLSLSHNDLTNLEERLFWDLLKSQQSEQYQGVSHCPGCDKFTLEKRVTFLENIMKYFI